MNFKHEINAVFGMVVFFVALLALVLVLYLQGTINYQTANVFTSALATVVTLTVLFSAFLSLEATRKKSLATSELSVRPYLIWNFEPKGREVILALESRNNQAFDLRFALEFGGAKHVIRERHIELSTSEHPRVYRIRIDEPLRKIMGGKTSGTLYISTSFFSELGGKYEHMYRKEIEGVRGGKFVFGQRQIHSINMPWFENLISFVEE